MNKCTLSEHICQLFPDMTPVCLCQELLQEDKESDLWAAGVHEIPPHLMGCWGAVPAWPRRALSVGWRCRWLHLPGRSNTLGPVKKDKNRLSAKQLPTTFECEISKTPATLTKNHKCNHWAAPVIYLSAPKHLNRVTRDIRWNEINVSTPVNYTDLMWNAWLYSSKWNAFIMVFGHRLATG